MRASVVMVFNAQLERIIPFVDLNVRSESERVGARLKHIRHLILMRVKSKLMENALVATRSRGHHRQPQVKVSTFIITFTSTFRSTFISTAYIHD